MTVTIKAICFWFWKSPPLTEAVATAIQLLTEHGLEVNEDLEFHSSSRVVLVTNSQNLDTLRAAQRAIESVLFSTSDLDCQIRAYSFSKRAEETVQAFERAFVSAKRNAETLAASANTQLNGVRWIRELSANAMGQRRADHDLLSSPSPESRDLFRTVYVEVSFELKTKGHMGT